ncbi:MAG: DUF1552 domain-containing protein [Myxococcota bacterium]
MKLSRRRMLLGAGAAAGGAAVLPWVLRSADSYADPTRAPRRIITIFSPNGPQFVVGPTEEGGTERNFDLHDWWSPLERHRNKAVFFRGCHQPGVPFGTNNEYGHQSGTIGALTATATNGTNSSRSPSIDQFIARRLFDQGVILPKRSMSWGLENRGRAAFYEDAGQPLDVTTNPYDVLADLSPSFMSEPDETAISALDRKHFALEHLREDCTRLRSRLDGDGRVLLDAHCANIEALEAGVAATIQSGNLGCREPEGPLSPLGADAQWSARENRDAAMAAFRELAALTFTCDVTRVIGFQFAGGAARFAIPESYGVPESGRVDSGDSGPQMHAWTHNGRDDNHLVAMRIFYQWFSEQVALLIDKLETTPDANGQPLMDSTLVVWTNEFGGLSPHNNSNVPVILFGNGGGSIDTGRLYQASGNKEERALPIHQLFVSLARHAGLDEVDSFGDHGSLSCGPLDWLAG